MKVFYSDEAGTFKVKYFRQDGTVEVIAGNGFETNNVVSLKAISSYHLSYQTKDEQRIFSQTGCVKLIATISGTVIFFKQLAKL